MSAVSVLVDSFFENLRPPPRLRLSQWADQYAYLSAESSAEPGKWKNIPYQVGILDAMTDPRVWKVVWKKSARVGYSKCIGHLAAYHMHYDPCPIGIVQPTEGDAEGYSKEEIAPMIRDTPVLEKIVSDAKAKDGSNTILQKMFPGGTLHLIGANSPKGFRRVSRRVMIFDEVDGYPESAGTEGDPIKLGVRRTEYFWNRKVVMGSTPVLALTSRIEPEFQASDQRYYNVPCPHCDAPQVLKFENLRWTKGEPETAHFVCVANGCVIDHKWKRWMVEEAYNRQEANPDCGFGWVATKPFRGIAGFHIWAAYSFSPNASWEQLAREWEEAEGNVEMLKTFVNTVLGEVWQERGDAPDWKRIYDRREHYPMKTIPEGGLFLTMGVDVQGNRLEAHVKAWGLNRERWTVDYQVIHGDTSKLGADGPWGELTKLIQATYPLAKSGLRLPVQLTAIDSGYNTQVVYQYVRRFPSSRVIATKGVDTQIPLIATPTMVDVAIQGRKMKRGLMMWPVGVGNGKSELYGFLRMESPTDTELKERGYPTGYCHYPQMGEDFFKQLTSEVLLKKKIRGRTRVKYEWEKQYDRNEVLDTEILARAAAAVFGIDRFTEEDWETLQGYIGEPVAEREGMGEPEAAPEAKPETRSSAPQVEEPRRPSRKYR